MLYLIKCTVPHDFICLFSSRKYTENNHDFYHHCRYTLFCNMLHVCVLWCLLPDNIATTNSQPTIEPARAPSSINQLKDTNSQEKKRKKNLRSCRKTSSHKVNTHISTNKKPSKTILSQVSQKKKTQGERR